MKKIILILCMTFATACTKQIAVKPPVTGPGYAFRADGSTYYVVVTSDAALQDAMKNIGCGICLPERIGDVYQIEKVSK